MQDDAKDDANVKDDPVSRKIFPRNLTARAAAEPRGNPPSTRPEDGSDNCFPGYDFDQRNLEKCFFPGLTFEFHLHEDGAIAREIPLDGVAAKAGVKPGDKPVFLWAIAGRTSASQSPDDAPRFSLEALSGLDVWARVRDLMPGRIAIVIGHAPVRRAGVKDEVKDALKEAFLKGTPKVKRGKHGKFRWAALVAERATYLDTNGVIDPARYEPGDLTRSLCTPWQYDFRDCGCHYWAASKPDVVTSQDGTQPYTSYMRRDRAPTADRPKFRERIPLALDYAELIAGDWNKKLPIVLNDQETKEFTILQPSARRKVMSLDQILEELTYLATVEHALSVQYLFAHYSLDAPMVLLVDQDVSTETREIFAAANEIFQIAIDEMRHLRWVNEALAIFKRPPELGRARVIGRSFHQKFALRPLTRNQLEWFIKVEKPSRSVGRDQNVDGMYVRVLESVEALKEDQIPSPARERKERLIHLIKLIIDEGDDHYQRFLKIKDHLENLTPKQYLRSLCDHRKKEKLDDLQRRLIAESDAKYRELLATMVMAFSEDDGSGVFLEQARRAMRSMHENNHRLAAEGIAPVFNLPEGFRETEPPGDPPPAESAPATGSTTPRESS